MSELVPAIIIVGLAAVLFWILRTFSDNNTRRKLFETRAGIHRDLVNRFASGEELIAYMSSPAGREVFGPAAVETPNPFKRILGAVQTGIVLVAVGSGLVTLSQTGWYGSDGRDGFAFLGILSFALGAGFLVSAFAAWKLSRRFGLIAPSAAAAAPSEE
ncbi:MAG TPA: hypothetical protein VGS57_07515 [Thermoanaerobaculia bacterium]|jgi:hypothetical protein|nr:hypothetical protein [Thermoanaerobaculia bacterium]